MSLVTLLGDEQDPPSPHSLDHDEVGQPAVSELYGTKRRTKLRSALLWAGAGAAALGLGLIAGMAHGATL